MSSGEEQVLQMVVAGIEAALAATEGLGRAGSFHDAVDAAGRAIAIYRTVEAALEHAETEPARRSVSKLRDAIAALHEILINARSVLAAEIDSLTSIGLAEQAAERRCLDDQIAKILDEWEW